MRDLPQERRLTDAEIEAFYLTFGEPPVMGVTYMTQKEFAECLRRYGGKDEQGVKGRAGGRVERLLSASDERALDTD